jgi:hypothetical protein
MATKTGFLDLPAELRNQIYQDYISDYEERPVIKPDKLNKAACVSISHLLKALDSEHALDLLLADKQIMDEALPLCLGHCTLHLQDLNQLDALHGVREDMNFQKIGGFVRSLTLGLSWFGHGIDRPLDHHPRTLQETRMLVPLPSRPMYWYHSSSGWHAISFRRLLVELKSYFPDVTSITVELDKATLSMQDDLRRGFFSLYWPSVREFKIRRPDLERMSTRTTEPQLFYNRRGVRGAMRPPQLIPWELDMECRFLESVNDELAKDMRKRRELADR